MSRLPVVGSDDGTWGTVLNDFLSQSINSDGTLNSFAVAGVSTLTQSIASIVTTGGVLTINKLNPVNANTGSLAMTLPTGAINGSLLGVVKTDSTTNTVVITGNIRGIPSSTITLKLTFEGVLFSADSSGSWWPIADHKTLSSLDARYDAVGFAAAETTRAMAAEAAISAQIAFTPVTISSNTTASYNTFILANASSGSFIVTLPSTLTAGHSFTIRKTDATTNIVTVTAPGGSLIVAGTLLGQPSVNLSINGQTATFTCDGTNFQANITSTTSITPEQCGALGDGTTDDTAAFSTAGIALQTLGGGTLSCRPGAVYRVGSQTLSGVQYLRNPIFAVTGATLPVIVQGNGAKIKVNDNVKIGAWLRGSAWYPNGPFVDVCTLTGLTTVGSTSTASFVVADAGLRVSVAGAGTAGAVLQTTVSSVVSTTVASGSNTANVSSITTLNVGSVGAAPAGGGIVWTNTSAGGALLQYTTASGTTFNGCSLLSGSGTLTTGATVTVTILSAAATSTLVNTTLTFSQTYSVLLSTRRLLVRSPRHTGSLSLRR